MSKQGDVHGGQQTRRTLFCGLGVCIVDFQCRAHVESLGKEEPNPTHSIVFVRRGLFARRDKQGMLVADANQILFFNEGQPYRYAHPLPGGDDCTILTLDDASARAAVERFPSARSIDREGPFPFGHAPVTTRAARVHHELLAILDGEPTGPDLVAQDLVAELIDEALLTLHRTNRLGETNPAAADVRWRKIVDATKLIVSDSIGNPPSLAELAAQLGCSPFHLSRVFRATTGLPLRRYIRRLRAALAAERLRHGQTDLTSLALDLGFSDHSHFTNSFRREWGISPSHARPDAVRRRAGHARSSRSPERSS